MAKTIPDNVFRGYDLRGVVGTELDEERVELLGKAYATWLLRRNIYDCVVGFDSRESSPLFRDALLKGLTESGVSVYDIGMTLSQICYFAQYYYRTRGMVMITASHNPKEYNGFKFGTGFSETMVTEEIIEFRELVRSGNFVTTGKKGTVKKEDIFDIYKDDLKRRVRKTGNFKVVVDSCAATTGLFMPTILREAGCEVIEQNTTPDPTFPVGVADPTEKDVLERLAKRVVAEKADLGFAYDTDGDRLGVVDEDGRMLWNDTLVSLFAKDIISSLPKAKIVYNVLCSKQVDDVIRTAGGTPLMWLTGHSFIKAKVKEEHAPFGGELSGHFFFVDNFYGHDDGAMASLRLLSYLTKVNMSLKDAVNELPPYISSPEIKVGCPDATKFKTVSKEIGDKVKAQYPNAEFTEIDGIRMDLPGNMFVIRASQNGPYLTAKFEAKTQAKYDELKHFVARILKEVKDIDMSKGVNTDALD
jgi:phosphomannomutase/phosphoglucomutase